MIKMDLNDNTWHKVKNSPKVLGFVGGTSDKPVPLENSEAESLIKSIQSDSSQPRPKVMFEPGEIVRIIDGPFNDFNGEVEKVDFEKNRLTVKVLVFGKPTPIELSLSQIEKVKNMAAKELITQVKLQVPAGSANPAPPVGPALGQHGLNIQDFCKQFNDRTKDNEKGLALPVIINVYKDRSFDFIIKSTPASILLKSLLVFKKVALPHRVIKLAR